MKQHKPFSLNAAALVIVPLSAIKATTAVAQIDAIWDAADDPATPVWRAQALAQLASKLYNKINS
jgi:hypothetical protein